MAKRVIAGLVAALVLFYIITSPGQSASVAHGAWNAAVSVAHGIGTFFDKLAS